MSALEFVNDRERNKERERDKEVECRKREKTGVEFYLTRTRRAQNAELYGHRERERGGNGGSRKY